MSVAEAVEVIRTDVLRFTVSGDPVPKQPGVLVGARVTKCARTSKYEFIVRLQCQYAARAVRWQASPADRFSVELRVFVRDQRRTDCDNLSKSILDGLKTIAFPDDSQVIDLLVSKRVDPFFPRVEITITRTSSVT